MGCGDMNWQNKCFCKNSHKAIVPVIEPSTLFVIAFWVFWISFTILVVLITHFLFVNLVVALGSLTREPVRVLNETEAPESHQHLFLAYDFQIEPVKIQRVQVGCEYWYGVVDQLEATSEEKDWIKKIMYCESKCNPDAVSSAGARNLMQFMSKTFYWQGGQDINDPYEQIELALKMYRKGMAHHWCCNSLI